MAKVMSAPGYVIAKTFAALRSLEKYEHGIQATPWMLDHYMTETKRQAAEVVQFVEEHPKLQSYLDTRGYPAERLRTLMGASERIAELLAESEVK